MSQGGKGSLSRKSLGDRPANVKAKEDNRKEKGVNVT